LNRTDIGRAAQAACILEAISSKPGNVNRSFDFADTTLADFLLSAVMIGKAMEEADRCPVGETIVRAIEATRSLVGRNTNLGMVLLFAPLARGAGNGDLRSALRNVLRATTVEDARLVAQAIRTANPGGLGKVSAQDVAGDPNIRLLELMTLARERDGIAREYTTDYQVIFELACPTLRSSMERTGDLPTSIVTTYLTVLSECPDTLIQRKQGPQQALEVSRRAKEILRERDAGSHMQEETLRSFDAFLRSEGNALNPGTSADLTAAAIFTFLLQDGLHAWHRLSA
jgi:triphosphoribosyl-dephospho-CoA synthase